MEQFVVDHNADDRHHSEHHGAQADEPEIASAQTSLDEPSGRTGIRHQWRDALQRLRTVAEAEHARSHRNREE